MQKLNNISKTLFIPLTGRMYVSEKFPHLLYDKKALELKNTLKDINFDYSKQSQYTLLASACRAYNMDREVRGFLKQNPKGAIVNLGAGLDTGFERVGIKSNFWFDLDLPEVMEVREKLLLPSEKNIYLSKSIFDYSWIDDVKKNNPTSVLVLASGLFYYFKPKIVLEILENLKALPTPLVIFDATNKTGLKRSNAYVEKMGNYKAQMYFYVNHAKKQFAHLTDEKNISSYPYYLYFKKEDISQLFLKTKLFFYVSDFFNMVRMVKIKLT